MRLLFVIDSLKQGGAERSFVLMAKHLKSLGWQIEFAIFNVESQDFRPELDASGIPVHELGWGGGWADARKLKLVLDHFCADVVLFCLYRTALRVRLLRYLRPHTVILESLVGMGHSGTLRAKGVIGYMKQYVRRNVDRLSARLWGMHYHAISHAVADHYVGMFGLPRSSITVVYRGRDAPAPISSEERRRIRRVVYGVGDDVSLFVSVGRLEPVKNHAAIVAAAAFIKQSRGSLPAAFALVGRDGQAGANVRQAVISHALEDKFRFLGFRADVASIIQAADVFLFPSLSEGLGCSVLEAMSVGLPILCSDIPAMREVAGSGSGFTFFRPDDVVGLSTALLAYLDEPAAYARNGASNIDIFQMNFVSESVYASMEKLIVHVAARVQPLERLS